MSEKKQPQNTFENNINQLEQIVKALQSGQLTLENALDHYEKGMKMSKDCEDQLRRAEERIHALTQQGSLSEAVEEMA